MSNSKSIIDENGNLKYSGFFIGPDSNFNYNKCDLDSVSNLKEWDKYIIYNEDYACELFTALFSSTLNLFLKFYDLNEREIYKYHLKKHIGIDEFNMPNNTKSGNIILSSKNCAISLIRNKGYKTIECLFKRLKAPHKKTDFYMNVWLNEETGKDHCAIIPNVVKKDNFIYSKSVNPIFANGIIKLGEKEIDLENSNSFATFEWLRGNFKYDMLKGTVLYKSFFSTYIGNKPFGFSIVCDVSNPEQCRGIINFDYDTYICDKVCIHKNKRDPMSDWMIFSDDGKFGLRFTPFLKCEDKFALKSNKMRVEKFFGYFHGEIILNRGVVKISKSIGIIEEKRF